MKKIIVTALMLSLIPVSFVWALNEQTPGDYAAGMGTKIGRGLLNIVTSPAEIPCTMNTDIKDKGGVGVATGFGKGIAFMLRRILVGATEVGTFMIPMEATIPPVCHDTTAV